MSEPIVDWVSLDDNDDEEDIEFAPRRAGPSLKRKSKLCAPAGETEGLLNIRSKLFRNPESYFDPFASPILFLRAPGRDCPSETPDPLTSMHRRLLPQAYGPYDDDLASLETSPRSSYQQVSKTIKRRKVLRRWPSSALAESTLLPHTRVYVRGTSGGEGNVFSDQGEELVEVMRRACFFGRERGFAESRVGLERIEDGTGTGTGVEVETEGIVGVKEAAKWLSERFDD